MTHRVFTQSIFKESGLTVMYFWASSCAPCLDELMALDRIAGEYGPDISIITVLWDSVDAEAAAFARSFAEENGLGLPMLEMTPSVRRAFIDRYGLHEAVPISFLIGSGGEPKSVIRHTQSYDEWRSLIGGAL